jgi:hypothetical protein
MCNLSAKILKGRRSNGLDKLTFHPGVFSNSLILRRTSAQSSLEEEVNVGPRGHEGCLLNRYTTLQTQC